MPNSAPPQRVIIIGAGPAGLALAIELGLRGVPCLVAERHSRVGHAPRAKTTNVRTREHLRRWGIAGRLAAASPFGVTYPSNIHFVTRLAGHRLATVENAFYCAPGRNPLYAEHSQWIPQYTLEHILKDFAQSLPGVTLKFGCELASFEQTQTHVSADLRDGETGHVSTVCASYLVGCDGARSAVRAGIGATMHGRAGLSRNFNVVFRAPGLAQAHRHGPAIMYWHVNRDYPALMGPMDTDDRWFFMPTGVDETHSSTDFEKASLIAKATGFDLPYEILSSDEWTASRLRADRYRRGRVFLAGDACHLHPPFGGYGMNMGIADSVDLGWKLAAVLQGWGGERLLESYERERQPVHDFVMDEAEANHAVLGRQLWRDGLEDAGDESDRLRAEVGETIRKAKLREFLTLGVMKGYRYANSPIIVSDGSRPPAFDFLNYVPSAHPGCVAPHAWLHDGPSLYDHFGAGFTLLIAGDTQEVGEVALADARTLGVPLTVITPTEPALPELYRARMTLIRPDQHVAWRGDTWPASGLRLLATVTGRSAPQ